MSKTACPVLCSNFTSSLSTVNVTSLLIFYGIECWLYFLYGNWASFKKHLRYLFYFRICKAARFIACEENYRIDCIAWESCQLPQRYSGGGDVE